jgi:hypothetical protein
VFPALEIFPVALSGELSYIVVIQGHLQASSFWKCFIGNESGDTDDLRRDMILAIGVVTFHTY